MRAVQTRTHDLAFSDQQVRKTFVRWEDGEADREWRCLQLVHEHAPGAAPRPLGRAVERGRPVVVMERLPGTPLGDGPLTSRQTASLGRVLRRLHSIPAGDVAAAGIGERRWGPSTLPEALRGWLEEGHDLSRCQDAGRVAHGVEVALAWLAQEPLPPAHLVGLGIADLNPANVLWDGTTCRLVDFEDGGLTDPAYDLADHVEHLAGRLADVLAPDALADAAGLSADGRTRMRTYRPLWAAFWLAMLLPGNRGFDRNPPGTTEAQADHLVGLLSLG